MVGLLSFPLRRKGGSGLGPRMAELGSSSVGGRPRGRCWRLFCSSWLAPAGGNGVWEVLGWGEPESSIRLLDLKAAGNAWPRAVTLTRQCVSVPENRKNSAKP